MNNLKTAINRIISAQRATERPLAIILAGHNGSGKSTMWREMLSDQLRIPLVNADRMMLAILPEPNSVGALTDWARELRDTNLSWMSVAQKGVQAFVAHAMQAKVPFAMETVFSHWQQRADGTFESKIDQIREMQAAGYFVLLLFVGLSSADLSALRVETRVAMNGHDVARERLFQRFPRTQRAVREALEVADASVLVDNSRDPKRAFTVCSVRLGPEKLYDLRQGESSVPVAISSWLDAVAPIAPQNT
ncbi:zeta toxin family protein [bacterium]|nr:zeta toxin family protein [bacterium]